MQGDIYIKTLHPPSIALFPLLPHFVVAPDYLSCSFTCAPMFPILTYISPPLIHPSSDPCKGAVLVLPYVLYLWGISWWKVEGLGSGKWGVWQSVEDTVACWHNSQTQNPCGHIRNISHMVPHHKQGQKTGGGWVCVRVQNCVWGCVVMMAREGSMREEGGERQTDYDPQPWLSTPAALTPPCQLQR